MKKQFTAGIWFDAGDRLPSFSHEKFGSVDDALGWINDVLRTDATAKTWEIRSADKTILHGPNYAFSFVPLWLVD